MKAKRKPTPRQRKAAKAHIDNFLSGKPITTGQMLENVGFSKGVSLTPNRVLESPGFKQALTEYGLTEELITTSLVTDIKGKPLKRTQELKLGAEILGMVKRDEKPPAENKNTYNFIFSEKVQAKVQIINDDIKRILTTPSHVQENPPDVETE